MDLNSSEIKYIEQRKSPAVATVLSFVISGAGQIYNGDIGKGIAFIVGYIVCWAAATLVFPIFILLAIWIGGMIEAHKRATELNASLKRRLEAQNAEAEAARVATITAADFAAQIQKYFKLKENSLLSEQEFELKKKDVIKGLGEKVISESAEDFLTEIIPLVREKALTEEEIGRIKAAYSDSFLNSKRRNVQMDLRHWRG